jgi:hypothetical protein
MRMLALAAVASFAATPPATFVDRSGDAAGGDISTVTVAAIGSVLSVSRGGVDRTSFAIAHSCGAQVTLAVARS